MPEPSTTAETTATALVPLSHTGEDKTTITDPGLLITTKTMASVLSSKATNTDTNTDTMPPIGAAKETVLSMDPGGVIQDPIHSDNSSL